MAATKDANDLNRRDFLKEGAGGLAAAGIMATVSGAYGDAKTDPGNFVDDGPPKPIGKIALEEHFALPDANDAAYDLQPTPGFRDQMLDLGAGRIAQMDGGGLEVCILSHTAPGIQAIPNPAQAIATSRRWNDYLAEQIAKFPKRLKGFAALPMQDANAAAAELIRCVQELGFCGALVNGFSQIGDPDSAVFYDLPQYRPFWKTVEELSVPFYLHPRLPLATRRQAYEGHPWMTGSAWGFAVETSIHALRLMGSGLFDEFPECNVILGHLGEGLPCNIWRVDHRISKIGPPTRAKLPLGYYLRNNFYVTTSGNFRTQAFNDVIFEIGADRVLYSVDYPYEDVHEAADWFDKVPIAESDRLAIARGNSKKLFRL